MKTVDIIKPGSINAFIGPTGTLKRILKNKSYFNQRGFIMNLYTKEGLFSEYTFSSNASKNRINYLIKYAKLFLKKISPYAFNNRYISILLLKMNNLNTYLFVNKYLKLNRKPDYVVFHSDVECYYFLKKNNNKNIKSILFLHTDGIPLKMIDEYYPLIKNTKYYKKLLRMQEYTINNIDKCVFICKNGQKNFLNYYSNIPINKTNVIINGIEDYTNVEKSNIKNIKKKINKFKYRLCCVASISKRKGHINILKALSCLNSDILEKIHLTIIGDGSERSRLEEFINANNLNENVEFTGNISNYDIYNYLEKANIFILMSNNEGLPISIIEAMRASLPIISTNVSGIPELVNSFENGILISPNENELRNILENIDNYNWNNMGINSRLRFENEFIFDRMMKEYCDMLDNIN